MFITLSSTLPWTEQLFKENTGNNSCWLRLVWTTKLYGGKKRKKKKLEMWFPNSKVSWLFYSLPGIRPHWHITHTPDLRTFSGSVPSPQLIGRKCQSPEKFQLTEDGTEMAKAQMRSEFLIKQHFKVTQARLPRAGKSLKTMNFILG